MKRNHFIKPFLFMRIQNSGIQQNDKIYEHNTYNADF